MAFVISTDPEIYTSISLTQKTLKAYKFLMEQNNDVNCVLQNPKILLIKHGDQVSSDDLTCLLGHAETGYHSITKELVENFKRWTCPFAVVVLLSASGGHGSCRLSGFVSRNFCYGQFGENVKISGPFNEDLDILEDVKKNTENLSDITFIIKDSRHSVAYSSKDLERLSEQIQLTLYGINRPNNVYINIFLSDDIQIPFRIGLRMHKSIQGCLLNIHRYSQNCVNEMNYQYKMFNKATVKIIKSLDEMILKGFQSYPLASTQRKKYIERFGNKIESFLGIGQGKQFNLLFQAVDVKRLTKSHITSIINTKLKYSKHRENGKSTKQIKSRVRNRQSNVYTASSTYAFKKTNNVNLTTFEAEKVAKMIYTDLNNKAQEYQEKFGIFSSNVEDECGNNSMHGVDIHELKILAYRHEKVSGFGYINGTVCVYIMGSKEEDKKDVLTFFEKYINTEEYNFRIEFRKKREITYFGKLETGSRINKLKTAGKGPKGYGTLGMFLEDNNGTYFFTTCAHVIEEHAEAYFPDDNTKIGENVFICHPNTNNDIKHASKMDLSLIRVCPDFDMECKLGLKSVNGNFIKGAIFKGDISEIFGRRLYKWGATEPYLQTGKCTGIEEDEFIHIQINTDKFAKPGDSGAIICAGRDDETALAAFVLVGEEMTQRKDKKTTYVVYKVADALEIVAHMTRAKKACLCTQTLTVCSASSSGAANRATVRI